MTISIWRYSHLALAISSFAFIFMASVTGIILAFQPISEQIQPYKANGFNQLTLAETLQTFASHYPEVISLEVDANDFVIASVFTNEGDALEGYFNPGTGAYLGKKIETSNFFKWTTNLHRSLFLKGTGRFFVGLSSLLLFLIAVSGGILILKRQKSFKRFFSKIVNDNFSQYWHVVLGRLFLIPIIVITLTGTYLSLERFEIVPKQGPPIHSIDYETLKSSAQVAFKDMPVFKETKLSEVKTVEYPFSDDPEDYFTVALKDKELVVDQFSGALISEVKYPLATFFSNMSLSLHTGQGSILWSLVLSFASLNILFFIYSGFAMTLKRRASRLKNKFKKNEAKYILLVGSENGGTLAFANALQQQLIALGETVYIDELNAYQRYKKAEHLVIMTSTHGDGDPPTNANKFLKRLASIKQKQAYSFSVVGFGSLSYLHYCKFALDVDAAFKKEEATQLTAPFTINDKSFDSFGQWVQLWSKQVGLNLVIPHAHLNPRPKETKSFEVVAKSNAHDNPDDTFLITLKPKQKVQFTSGDLLAIYPKNDHRERLYSIGKVNGHTQLSVKRLDDGLGSTFLHECQIGDCCKARLIKNKRFHIPKKATKVIMIANGTGIAPFLGMLDQNKKTKCEAYFGLRTEQSCCLYQSQLEQHLKHQKLTKLHLAYSRQNNCCYVQHLLERDAAHIAKVLKNNGHIMICGSLPMYRDVMKILDDICLKHNKKPVSSYADNIKSDCY